MSALSNQSEVPPPPPTPQHSSEKLFCRYAGNLQGNNFPSGYLPDHYGGTGAWCEICSKLAMKTPE